MTRGNSMFNPSTWLTRARASRREGLYEHDGILFDLDEGTFTNTIFGRTETRPLSPTILAKMREMGFEEWAKTTRETRILPNGQKHGCYDRE